MNCTWNNIDTSQWKIIAAWIQRNGKWDYWSASASALDMIKNFSAMKWLNSLQVQYSYWLHQLLCSQELNLTHLYWSFWQKKKQARWKSKLSLHIAKPGGQYKKARLPRTMCPRTIKSLGWNLGYKVFRNSVLFGFASSPHWPTSQLADVPRHLSESSIQSPAQITSNTLLDLETQFSWVHLKI